MTTTETARACPGDLVAYRVGLHPPTPPNVFATTLGSHRGSAAGILLIRRPGRESITVRPDEVVVVVPGSRIVERFDRYAAAALEHPAGCPDCGERGAHVYTIGGWDRLFCRSCGDVWEVAQSVIDDAEMAPCPKCEATLIHRDEHVCEDCAHRRLDAIDDARSDA